MWMYIYLSCFKKSFSFITLQSAIQKYYITFQNADVIYLLIHV
jgi:hypothetical protein